MFISPLEELHVTVSKIKKVDLFVIGGGINGCGIARDAAGRGLSVTLAEMNDIGGATSSSSTKLFHGGLRYLEYFEFRLVRESLIEREVLLRMMPHISWPMRFVLPLSSEMRFENSTPTSRLLNFLMPWAKGKRPAWLIRLGLFLYDNLGGRKILPGTSSISLGNDLAGNALKKKFKKAFEYSDCWIEDNKLVALNALDAKNRGAKILTRTKVIEAKRVDGFWKIILENQITREVEEHHAKVLINAAGPWVADVINSKLQLNSKDNIRLVRGSHIVVPKLYDHDKCYFFQGTDGRIIFSIPYEYDFTLIGTTDADHDGIETKPSVVMLKGIILLILHRSILLKKYLQKILFGVIQVFVHFMMMVQKTPRQPLVIMSSNWSIMEVVHLYLIYLVERSQLIENWQRLLLQRFLNSFLI